MLIRHVEINNFRGIRHLDWHVQGRIICLLGPGDSTKTTILDAIESALAPRWYLPFSDCDFHQSNSQQPIRILVTIGELTDELQCDDRCGLYLRGYNSETGIHDEPDEGFEPVVTLRLEVGEDLEPRWELVKDGLPDPKTLSWRDRERLCMSRLGEDLFRHLTWSRGSALARITDRSTATGPILALANRAAGGAIADKSHAELEAAAQKAIEAAKEFGVRLTGLRPGLDTQSLGFGVGALSLHDSHGVPTRQIGLGSRRLASLAIQSVGLGGEAILLIDEVEHGLEPHRIRRLLRQVEEGRRDKPTSASDEKGRGQVIMTTHSPTPIMALGLSDLRFVQCRNGITTVEQPQVASDRMQRMARTLAHAFLAEKILVCEGKTEEALCRSLEAYWMKNGKDSFAYAGMVAVNGNGRCDGPEIAVEFNRLGYNVCFFGDSDEPLSVSQAEMTSKGITVVIWSGGMATEDRIAVDLPLAALQGVVSEAISLIGRSNVLAAIEAGVEQSIEGLGESIDSWIVKGIDEPTIRMAIGKAAKAKNGSWFKNLNAGQVLGEIVTGALEHIPESELVASFASLESWIYGE